LSEIDVRADIRRVNRQNSFEIRRRHLRCGFDFWQSVREYKRLRVSGAISIAFIAALEQFQNHVAVPFQLYNSLFTSLPFNRIEKTGILLSLFLNNCEEGYERRSKALRNRRRFFQQSHVDRK
jgi:hypothetical protein